MKKTFLIGAVCCVGALAKAQGEDPVLMTIAGKPVHKSEFEYIYNKNSSNTLEGKKSLKEYTDMFVNFKLKVAEAEARGYDTTRTFINELDGYRKQLAQPYLVDKSVDEKMQRNAYNRLINHVEASHILIGLGKGTPQDTLQAYQKALEVRNRILKGEDFGKVAKEVSEDPSAKFNGGYLGYFKGFQMVFPFEDAAYQLKIGELSMPVRTQFGYHIIKKTGERNDQGEIRVAHIMARMTPESTEEEKKAAKTKIERAYQELKEGKEFAEVAKKESDDSYSASKGGEMPPFEGCSLPKEFEEVAFGLQNTGDYSKPFTTDFGWHIVKLLGKSPSPSFDKRQADIARMLSRDERGNSGKTAALNRMKKEYQFQVNPNAIQEITAYCAATPDSMILSQLSSLQGTLFTLAGKEYPQADFVASLKKKGDKCHQATASFFNQRLEGYLDEQILGYEETQLENKYADFRNLMREYHDGILLFEVSNQEVWEKAAKDEKGLAKYYAKNKKKYRFPADRFKGYVLQCKDDETLAKAKELIKKSPADSVLIKVRKALNDSVSRVKIEKVLAAKGENKWVDETIFAAEKKTEKDKNFPVVEVVGKTIKAPESYKDVRGLVTSDYQAEVEKKWIASLRKKFKIEINKSALESLESNK